MIERGVVVLAARRALSAPILVSVAAIALAADLVDWRGATGLPRGDELILRGLERRGLWIALALTLGCATAAGAAGRFARWRAREVEWIAALPLARWRWLAATWCGDALAAGALVILAAGFVELAVGAGAPTTRVLRRVELPSIALVDERSHVGWELDDAPSGAHARIELALAGGGRAAEVRWIAKRGELATATVATVGLRTTLELALPPGDGPVALELERLASGAIVVADAGGLVLTEPVGGDRAASWLVAARVWSALVAADALALGFSAWFSAATAFGLTASLWLAGWLAARAPALLPAADLFDALDFVAAGLVPPAPAVAGFAGAAALAALGIAIGAQRAWAREP